MAGFANIRLQSSTLFQLAVYTEIIFEQMTRSDLIARLAELHPQLFAKDAESVVKVILDVLAGTLAKGGLGIDENQHRIYKYYRPGF